MTVDPEAPAARSLDRASGRPDVMGPAYPAAAERLFAALRASDVAAAEALTPPHDLVARTLAEIERREATPEVPGHFTLSADEAAEVDAYFDSRSRSSGRGAEGAEGAGPTSRPVRLLGGLEALGPDAACSRGADEAADAALDRIHAMRDADRLTAQLETLRQAGGVDGGGGVRRLSLRQVLSAAAIFILGVTLLLPMLERTRAEAQRVACRENLRESGAGFASYAADHRGVMPRLPESTGVLPRLAGAGLLSNTAHLFQLARGGYVAPNRLACQTSEYTAPRNPIGMTSPAGSLPLAVIYSYQNQFSAEPLVLEAARPGLAVLADKNPRYFATARGTRFDPTQPVLASSPLHRRAGQNVLLIDGSSAWFIQPVVDGDQIWGVDGTAGGQAVEFRMPSDISRDAYLVP